MKQRIFALLLAAFLLCETAAAAPSYLIPGGGTVGIELFTQGLLVTQVADSSPAAAAGIQIGDRLLRANGQTLTKAEQLAALAAEGRAIVLSTERNGKPAEYLLTPEQTPDGLRLGLFLRDHIAGIGTVTYYDPLTGDFGALGHGVGDTQSETLLPISAGALIASEVTETVRGRRGSPGALKGSFDPENILGTVSANTEHGIFGTVSEIPLRPAVPLASPDEIRLGEAEIYANIEGTAVERYSVRIDRLFPDAKNGRNLLLTVTDKRLLEKTGGIVQGMSGSPIIQNGRLVGAVTHVFVADPSRGYAVSIQDMLSSAGIPDLAA